MRVLSPEVKRLADGLYDIRIAIVNDGDMPTATAFARSKSTAPPFVVRLSTDLDHIISGNRIAVVWGIDAHHARSEHHWIIRTDDLAAETIEIDDPHAGPTTLRLTPPSEH